MPMIISVNHQPSGGKEWVAEITGRHPKYGFTRRFIPMLARDWSSTGKTGVTLFVLDEGKVYEVNAPYKGRRFVRVEGEDIREILLEEAMRYAEVCRRT